MQRTEAELAQVLHTGPFHLALRTAFSVRGLPLQRVQHHLAHRGVKVGVTSLSYWQQGARRPQRAESLRAVRALEEVLELPRNSLLRLLRGGDSPTASERPAARSYRSATEASGAVERLLDALESPADGGLHTVGHQERVRIGAGRELRRRDSQHVVRAHRDGIDRYLAVYRGDPGCDPARVEVVARENCRTGRVRRDRRSGCSSPNCSSIPGCRWARRTCSDTDSTTVRAARAASTCAASASAADSTYCRCASTRPRCRYGAGGSPRQRQGLRGPAVPTSRSPDGTGPSTWWSRGAARPGGHRLGLGVTNGSGADGDG